MDAIVMCGGEGSRLDADVEKPLVEVCGRPMVDRVVAALAESRVDAVHAVGSPATPRTREHLEVPYIDAPGDGYIPDLRYALGRVGHPVLTVAADLPLLAGDAVDTVVDAYAGRSLAVCVPVALKELLGASVDTTTEAAGRAVSPAGVNVVARGDAQDVLTTYDVRFAVNVNRRSDATIAEALA